MFLIYVITFADAYHEVWLYPEDADLDATAHEVQGLIDRRNAIPDAPQIVKTQRMVGMVYQKHAPAELDCGECGAAVPHGAELIGPWHAESCSLHPSATVS